MIYTYEMFQDEILEWERSDSPELRISVSDCSNTLRQNLIIWANSFGYNASLHSYNHNQVHFLILNKNQKYVHHLNKDVSIIDNYIPATATLDPEPLELDIINNNIEWDNCFVSIPDIDDIPNFQSDIQNYKVLGIDLSEKEISDIAVKDYIEELKKLTDQIITKDSITYQAFQTLISTAYENFRKRNI